MTLASLSCMNLKNFKAFCTDIVVLLLFASINVMALEKKIIISRKRKFVEYNPINTI